MGKKTRCNFRSRRLEQNVGTPDTSPLLDETQDMKKVEVPHVVDFKVHKSPRTKKVKLVASYLPEHSLGEPTEHDLAMELLAFEKLGYLSKTDHEIEDKTLIQYGDKFGLSVINDYPGFFKLVPQHPHYGQVSLDHVNEADAENYWDLFIPLIHRGLSAVRNNNRKGIAAVERRISHFSIQGFDMRHLQAYINACRHLQEGRSVLTCAIEKVDEEIKAEKKKIDEIVAGKSVLGEIEDLEAEKTRYQELIAEIDMLVNSKRKLLEEEKSIRATNTSPLYDMLLGTKEELGKRVSQMIDNAKALMIEGALTSD